MKFKSLICCIVTLVCLSACKSQTTVLPYFVDLKENKSGSIPMDDYLTSIKPDDELFISVTSASPEATAIFNLPAANPATAGAYAPSYQTYRVDSEGYINFPELGKMHVAGMTLEQLEKDLTHRIAAEVDNPVVTVRLVNFKVNVTGEVNRPGPINVTSNRFSILDALSSAGDLTPYGERENVLLIREINGKKEYVHLNLNSSEVLTSPYFYLQQNDYVYVEPNKIKQSNSKYNQDNAFKLSVISTVVSAASVIATLVIALTVK